MKKNIHLNLNALFNSLTEANFREHRLVFDEAPAKEPTSEVQDRESDDAENARAEEAKAIEAKKIDDAKVFLTNKLTGVDTSKLDIKANDVTQTSDATLAVESVKASYKGITFEVDESTTSAGAETLQTLTSDQFDSFTFLPGSNIDLAKGEAKLIVDTRTMFREGSPDGVTVTVDLKTNEIKSIAIDPSVGNTNIDTKINELIGKPLTDLTSDSLSSLITLYKETKDKELEDNLANILNGMTGVDLKLERSENEVTIEANGKPQVKITVESKEGGIIKGKTNIMDMPVDLPFQMDTTKIPIEIEITIGDRKINLNIDGNGFEMTGLGKDGNDKLALKIGGKGSRPEITFNGAVIDQDAKVDMVDMFGGEGNLKKAGFTDAQISEMSNAPLAPSADTTDGASAAPGSSAEGDKDKDKKKSALDKYVSPEMQAGMKDFMGTIQELIATVLELLESLGIDLNKDNDSDKRLWMFATKNELGPKNVGKLKDISMTAFMNCYVPSDNPGEKGKMDETIANLQAQGFDTDGKNGQKLFEALEHIYDNMHNPDNEKSPELLARLGKEGNKDANTFLYDSGLVDRNGRWSSSWERSTEHTPSERLALFVDENKLGKANADKLNGISAQELLTTIHVEGNEAATIQHLRAARFDVSGDNGKNLYKLLEDLASNIAANESMKTYVNEHLTTNLNDLLSETGMIDNDGKFTSSWKIKEAPVATAEAPDPSSIEAVKARLNAKEAGKMDAEKVTDYLINTGLTFGGKTIKIDAKAKNPCTALMETDIQSADQIISSLDVNDAAFKTSATNLGLSPENLLTVIKWLHEPKSGDYKGTTMTLSNLYGLGSDNKYTIADLIVATMTSSSEGVDFSTPAATS